MDPPADEKLTQLPVFEGLMNIRRNGPTFNKLLRLFSSGLLFLGFGSFKVVKRTARKGRNPRTGAVLKIRAHKTPRFTAGKSLKDLLK